MFLNETSNQLRFLAENIGSGVPALFLKHGCPVGRGVADVSPGRSGLFGFVLDPDNVAPVGAVCSRGNIFPLVHFIEDIGGEWVFEEFALDPVLAACERSAAFR